MIITGMTPSTTVPATRAGNDSPEPCDDNGHGTHTIGTVIGDDGAGNQIGNGAGREVDRLP